MNYQEIHQLFGTPLLQVPRPQLPFQLTKGNIILIAAVLGLAIYGGCKLYGEIFDSRPHSRIYPVS